jgi:cold shock CspA family protein
MERGFGFIAPDGAGGDVFCHMHSVVAADASGKS